MQHSKDIELITLLEVSKALGSTMGLERKLASAMKILSEFMDMKRGTVTLLDRDTMEMRIVAAHGLTMEEIRRGKYRIGEGIVGKVLKTGFPMVIPNIGEEPMFLNRTKARAGVAKENISFLCVPIKLRGETFGVLSVDRLFGQRVSYEQDLRVLKLVSSLIAQAVKLHELIAWERKEKEDLKRQLKARYSLGNIIGSSKGMQEVFRTVHKVAKSRATVLLRGESGTGKELIARAVHTNSERADRPFIKVNCAAIPENLLESEFFGHEKGAFTGAIAQRKGRFELADTGTIFLDEVGEIPPALQGKLLRTLQEREFERVGGNKTIKVDVRVIAATNRNLEDDIKSGIFRDDLYWRLNVVPIFLPPLRERAEDIPMLIEYFLKRFNEENQKSITIHQKAFNLLLRYPWPGNVRELENTIERLVVLSEGSLIRDDDLPLYIRSTPSILPSSLPGSIEAMEKERILKALDEHRWVYTKAAKALGLTDRQLGYRIKKYGIKLQSS